MRSQLASDVEHVSPQGYFGRCREIVTSEQAERYQEIFPPIFDQACRGCSSATATIRICTAHVCTSLADQLRKEGVDASIDHPTDANGAKLRSISEAFDG